MHTQDENTPPILGFKIRLLPAAVTACPLMLILCLLILGCSPLGITDPKSDIPFRDSQQRTNSKKTWVKKTRAKKNLGSETHPY